VPKVTLLAAIRTGTIDEGDDTWLASLTAEMLKEGTARRSAAEIARRSAEMGGGLFARAGGEQMSVGISVLSEHAADAAALVAEVLREPGLPESELPRILGSFQRRLAVAKSDPGSLADEALAQMTWGEHPFGRAFPTEQQLAAYTVDDVRRFHAENFGARRTHVYVAGRYDRRALEAALRQAFGGWAAGPEPTSNPPALRRGPALRFVDRPDAPQSVIRLALPAPDPSLPDWMPFSLMNTLLGGAFSSRITTNIREDKGYAYSPNSSVVARRRAAVWVQDADVATADTAAALTEIMAEIRRLAQRAAPRGRTRADPELPRRPVRRAELLADRRAGPARLPRPARPAAGLPDELGRERLRGHAHGCHRHGGTLAGPLAAQPRGGGRPREDRGPAARPAGAGGSGRTLTRSPKRTGTQA
jgi:zinc protease